MHTPGYGWEIIPGLGCYHVLPIDDLRPHTCGLGCYCRPQEDDGVVIHVAMDRRDSSVH